MSAASSGAIFGDREPRVVETAATGVQVSRSFNWTEQTVVASKRPAVSFDAFGRKTIAAPATATGQVIGEGPMTRSGYATVARTLLGVAGRAPGRGEQATMVRSSLLRPNRGLPDGRGCSVDIAGTHPGNKTLMVRGPELYIYAVLDMSTGKIVVVFVADMSSCPDPKNPTVSCLHVAPYLTTHGEPVDCMAEVPVVESEAELADAYRNYRETEGLIGETVCPVVAFMIFASTERHGDFVPPILAGRYSVTDKRVSEVLLAKNNHDFSHEMHDVRMPTVFDIIRSAAPSLRPIALIVPVPGNSGQSLPGKRSVDHESARADDDGRDSRSASRSTRADDDGRDSRGVFKRTRADDDDRDSRSSSRSTRADDDGLSGRGTPTPPSVAAGDTKDVFKRPRVDVGSAGSSGVASTLGDLAKNIEAQLETERRRTEKEKDGRVAAEGRATQLEKKLKDARAATHENKVVADRLAADLLRARGELGDLEREVEDARTKSVMLDYELDLSKERQSELGHELDLSKKRLLELETELRELRARDEKLGKLESRTQALVDENKRLSEQIASAKSAPDNTEALREEICKLRGEKDAIEALYTRTKANVTAHIKVINRQAAERKAEAQRLREALAEMQEKLAEMQKEPAEMQKEPAVERGAEMQTSEQLLAPVSPGDPVKRGSVVQVCWPVEGGETEIYTGVVAVASSMTVLFADMPKNLCLKQQAGTNLKRVHELPREAWQYRIVAALPE